MKNNHRQNIFKRESFNPSGLLISSNTYVKAIQGLALILAMGLLGLSQGAQAQHQFAFNVGLGAPYLIQAGLEYSHSSRQFSAEVGYNQLKYTFEDVDIALTKPELSLRWHPAEGAFFVGAGVGQMDLDLGVTGTVSAQTVNIDVNFKAMTVTPKIGWLWGYSGGGFFGGLDLGLQVPLSTSSSLTTNADPLLQAQPEFQQLRNDVEDVEKLLGKTSLPVVTVLRLGYLF